MEKKQLNDLETYGTVGYVIVTNGGMAWGSTFRTNRDRCIQDFKKSVDYNFFDHNRWDCEECIIITKERLKLI